MEEYINKVNQLLSQYQFSEEDKNIFWEIIYPIFSHEEFQKRLDSKQYPHHGTKSLGEHIITDAIVTYIMAKKQIKKGIHISLKTAVQIALFHDLYEIPWQNSGIKPAMFVNQHGFVHPIEAAINSAFWFPQYFEDSQHAQIITDSIIHHMYPFPVRSINTTFQDAEIHNLEKLEKLSSKIRNLIIQSSMRSRVGNVSFAPSLFMEGRIMAQADKYVSICQDVNSFSSLLTYATGKNPKLDNYKGKKRS